ncbi:hypothetical protein BD324DRAFT_16702 [Kockovaella imperatae]|uniref:Uncharacterized protein n=1 Tax=Kockovaella imperatae TaxID=4999 RepID=A0A1Y1USU6_9TREE|nr:hypothetical protein BD324DRAFT_16702 [Kockovaella imperatae]ORX40707.1 hypothetical protein BD324DRAFT_16702 [Kockovaella imperatae]
MSRSAFPAAPSPTPVPLPSSSSPNPRPAAQSPSGVSYESISPSDRSVFERKVRRYEDWTTDVTRQGGLRPSESSYGRFAGVGSASWSSLPTVKALSRDGTEPSTIVHQRNRANEALRNPHGHDRSLVDDIGVGSPGLGGHQPMRKPKVHQAGLSAEPDSRPTENHHSAPRQPSRATMRQHLPTPYLAKAPSPPRRDQVPDVLNAYQPGETHTHLRIPSASPGDHRSSGHSSRSAYREREAYISSALHLPIEMLSETQPGAHSWKGPKETVKRWTSLIRKTSLRNEGQTTNRPKRILSGPEAFRPIDRNNGKSAARELSRRAEIASSKALGRSQTIPATLARDKPNIDEAKQSSTSLPARNKSSLMSRDSPRKAVPALFPEVRIGESPTSQNPDRTPGNAGRMNEGIPDHGQLEEHPKLPRDPTQRHLAVPGVTTSVRALGSAKSGQSTRSSSRLNRDQLHALHADDPASQANRLRPERLPPPLPAPALSRSFSSTDGLTKTLGRRFRDPSLTNLTARFEPNMYPLPDSAPTGDERALSPVKSTLRQRLDRATVPDRRRQDKPSDEEARLESTRPFISESAARQTQTTAPVTVTPGLMHLQPQSTLDSRLLSVTSPRSPTSRGSSPTPLEHRQDVQHVQFSSPARTAHRNDAEEVHFEVPSRTNGRLRVSVAWLRDRDGQREIATDNDTESLTPPSLPPKASAHAAGTAKREAPRSPSTPVPVFSPGPDFATGYPTSAPGSPIPLGQNHGYPYWNDGRIAHYPPSRLPQTFPWNPVQMPMTYPQPGRLYPHWLSTGHIPSHPHPRAPSPPRPPSIDPPSSRGSPVAHNAELPLSYGVTGQTTLSPDRAWYPPPPLPSPTHQNNNLLASLSGRTRSSMFGKLFRRDQRRDQDTSTINRWRKGVPLHSPPPAASTTFGGRDPVSVRVYPHQLGYRQPVSRPAWWNRPSKTAWTSERPNQVDREYAQDRDREGKLQNKMKRGDNRGIWGLFSGSIDRNYLERDSGRHHTASRRGGVSHDNTDGREGPCLAPNGSQQGRRLGMAQRFSGRWNGNIGRPQNQLNQTTSSGEDYNRDQRLRVKQRRREKKRERREAREKRRKARVEDGPRRMRGDRGFFGARTREATPGGRPPALLSRQKSTLGRERREEFGRGREDTRMVGDWKRALSTFLPRSRRGAERRHQGEAR